MPEVHHEWYCWNIVSSDLSRTICGSLLSGGSNSEGLVDTKLIPRHQVWLDLEHLGRHWVILEILADPLQINQG